MRFATISFIAIFVVFVAAQDLMDQRIIDEVNNNPESTWVAASHEQFEGWTLDEGKQLLGVDFLKPRSARLKSRGIRPTPIGIPEEYNFMTAYPQCAKDARDQGRCGSCWAFAAVETLGRRFCQATNGSVNPLLSVEYMIACDEEDAGCQGGNLDNAWEFLKRTGTVDEKCVPYTSGSSGVVSKCPHHCTSGEQFKIYKAARYYDIFGDVPTMQRDLIANGPIQVGMQVYEDFFHYAGGVYKHTSGQIAGGHSIQLVGWGTEKGVDYWLCRNSWGPNWGISGGFFKILRGVDECGIADNAVAGLPDLRAARV